MSEGFDEIQEGGIFIDQYTTIPMVNMIYDTGDRHDDKKNGKGVITFRFTPFFDSTGGVYIFEHSKIYNDSLIKKFIE